MIIKYPNPILRKKAKNIEQITPEIKKLAQKMTKLMIDRQGAGLAANQVGGLKRIITYIDNDKAKILINPEIIRKSTAIIESEEGCLSFPNLYGLVVRSAKIQVKAKNQFGKNLNFKAENILAVIIQHEIDHLDGILFIDKVKPNTLRHTEETEKQKNESESFPSGKN